MKTVYIFFALSISYWTYIPKIRVVGQMGWPVENTKIKRKNMKNCPKIDNFQKFKIFILHLFKTNWNTHLFQSTCFYMQRGLSKIEICWVQKWWERLYYNSNILQLQRASPLTPLDIKCPFCKYLLMWGWWFIPPGEGDGSWMKKLVKIFQIYLDLHHLLYNFHNFPGNTPAIWGQ